MSETWIILGASSAMARALARDLAEQGHGLILAGRDMDDIEMTASDCRARGAAQVLSMLCDMRVPDSFAPVLEAARAQDGLISAAVFVGSMPDQAVIDDDPSLIDGTVTDSFTGPAMFLQALAPLIEEHGGGSVVGIGSVAGDRGRVGNYVYGAAKAGFHTYLSGLRNRLARTGAHVVTVKPGFVDTAMTWGLPGMFLVAPPEKVSDDILRAVKRRKNVIYTPFFWRGIMAIIRSIPESIFKKLSI